MQASYVGLVPVGDDVADVVVADLAVLAQGGEAAPGRAEQFRHTAGGVGDYDRETCWCDYRLGVLQAPLISALGFAFAAATERGDDMVLAMLSRGCQAIRELGTLDLIEH